tara:strand:+ start:8576 stop:9133 length:558 start_codon:yes stop_codon:yes gene_type:complete
MKTVKLKLSSIKPYWRNPRNNDGTIVALMNSIEEFGYTNPIVVDKRNVILAGHARYQALMGLDWTEAEVLKVDLPEDSARRFRIADNKAGELSEWDIAKLKEEVEELGFESVELFFNTDEWKSILDIKELTDGMEEDESEFKGEEEDTHVIELLCPHCLAEIGFTREELRTLIKSSLPEEEPTPE